MTQENNDLTIVLGLFIAMTAIVIALTLNDNKEDPQFYLTGQLVATDPRDLQYSEFCSNLWVVKGYTGMDRYNVANTREECPITNIKVERGAAK
jgi:uncharacterized oligopeptide transporter (OPT) family protein